MPPCLPRVPQHHRYFCRPPVGCGGNGTASLDTMPYRMSFSPLPSLLLWPLMPNSLSFSFPANILLPTWHHGCPETLDLHITSPLQEVTFHQAVSTPGHALEVGSPEEAHSPSICMTGVGFHPIVVQALGGPVQDMVELIQDLSTLFNQHINSLDSPNPTSHASLAELQSPYCGGTYAFGAAGCLFSPVVDGIIWLTSIQIDCVFHSLYGLIIAGKIF